MCRKKRERVRLHGRFAKPPHGRSRAASVDDSAGEREFILFVRACCAGTIYCFPSYDVSPFRFGSLGLYRLRPSLSRFFICGRTMFARSVVLCTVIIQSRILLIKAQLSIGSRGQRIRVRKQSACGCTHRTRSARSEERRGRLRGVPKIPRQLAARRGPTTRAHST